MGFGVGLFLRQSYRNPFWDTAETDPEKVNASYLATGRIQEPAVLPAQSLTLINSGFVKNKPIETAAFSLCFVLFPQTREKRKRKLYRVEIL